MAILSITAAKPSVATALPRHSNRKHDNNHCQLMTLKLRICQVICCFSVLNHYPISLHHCKHACTSPVCLCSCRLLQATVHWLFSLGFSNFMAVLLIECTFYTHIRLTHFSVTLYAMQLWQSLETTFRVRETI